MKKGKGQRWIVLALLLLAVAARFVYPAGRALLRQRAAEVFAADVRKLELVETVGRAVSGSDALVAAIKSLERAA